MSLVDPVVEHKTDDQGVILNPDKPTPTDKSHSLPDKFKGKTPEQIAEAYLNLEKEHGRLSNDLGEQRKLTDRVLSLEENRQTPASEPAAPAEIDATELLANPGATLDSYFDNRMREERAEYEKRIDALESQVGQQSVASKHDDVQELVNDPAFISYVQENPIRQRLAASAVQQNDSAALDYLLTDYKERRGTAPADDADPAGDPNTVDPLEAARAAALESAGSGEGTSSGKVFSRAALIRMKLEDPEGYSDPVFQAEVMSAYSEGRVK